jgi:hypothetical protein
MSSAGHVSDMNSRLKSNRDQMNARKEKHQRVLGVYRQHPKHQALIDDKKLSPEEFEKYTDELHQKFASDRRKYWIAFFVIILMLLFLIGYIFL